MVRLVLSLEVTALESATDNRPTTLKRTVDTTAIVKDGNTVVLGGLIDDSESVSVIKVPCLGDIPGFGMLFSTRSTGFGKSNLYIFLTPRVIQNPVEASKVSTHKREQIDHVPKKIDLFHRKSDTPSMEELQIPAPRGSDEALPEATAPRSSGYEKPAYVAEPAQVESTGAAVGDSEQPRGAGSPRVRLAAAESTGRLRASRSPRPTFPRRCVS